MSPPSLTPLLGSLHALQVPIPYPMKTVTVLIDAPTHGPLTLIDCGIHTPEAQTALEEGLAALGRHWSDVERVILTHPHPDHYGLAGLIEERSGASVQMLDVEIAHGADYWRRLNEWLPRQNAWIAENGLPPEYREILRSEDSRVRVAARLHPLHASESVSLAGHDWEVLWLPGHADGHLGLWNAAESLLIAGDAILPRISPNIGLYVYTRPDPLGDYFQTLDQLERLDPVRAVVGHYGPTMTGVAARARELRAHHHERLDFLRAAAAQTPRHAYALSLAMFPRELDLAGRRFALAETLAHLEHLRLLGQVGRSWEEGAGVWLYHAD